MSARKVVWNLIWVGEKSLLIFWNTTLGKPIIQKGDIINGPEYSKVLEWVKFFFA